MSHIPPTATRDAEIAGFEIAHPLELRDGNRIAVRECGRGEPLLLVHGFTGSSEAWPRPLIRGLAAHFHVLAPDLIGHGQSSRVRDPARASLDAVLRDLEEVLASRGASGAHWVGYSMGGRITVGALVRTPDRVRSAVLEGSSPGLASESERAARRESDQKLAARILDEGIEAFVEHWTHLPLFDSQAKLAPDVRALQRRIRLANDPESLAASLAGLGTGAQPSLWESLGQIRAPVLLLTGHLDPKFCAIAERMHARIPKAQRCILEDAGHTTHLEQPDAFLDAVLRFHAKSR